MKIHFNETASVYYEQLYLLIQQVLLLTSDKQLSSPNQSSSLLISILSRK